MSYVEQQLLKGETVVYRARLTPLLYAAPAVFLGIGAAFLAIEALRPVGIILLPIALVALTMTHVRRVTSEFAVTDRRVIIKTGLMSRQTLETHLEKIEGVGVDQSIVGRLFRYGNITVKGTGGTSKPFALISRPMRFRKAVQEMASGIAVARPQTAPAATPVSAPPREDVIGRLERLGQLRDRGVLTPDEFEREKEQVLKAGR